MPLAEFYDLAIGKKKIDDFKLNTTQKYNKLDKMAKKLILLLKMIRLITKKIIST